MPVSVGENEYGQANDAAVANTTITPEMVRQVADKVYARLLLDLRIERERQRLPRRQVGRGRPTR
jgi:hypothetical protein